LGMTRLRRCRINNELERTVASGRHHASSILDIEVDTDDGDFEDGAEGRGSAIGDAKTSVPVS